MRSTIRLARSSPARISGRPVTGQIERRLIPRECGTGDPPRPYASRVDLLNEARVAHLATADQYARPHVVPIVFVYEHPRLYTPIDAKSKRSDDPHRLRRVQNVVTNGRASVVIDVWDEDWSRLRYVLLEGTADLLESGEERDRAISLLGTKYPQYGALPLGDAPVIRVTVERRVDWGPFGTTAGADRPQR